MTRSVLPAKGCGELSVALVDRLVVFVAPLHGLRDVLLHQQDAERNRVLRRRRRENAEAVDEVGEHQRDGAEEIEVRPHAGGARLLAKAQGGVERDAAAEDRHEGKPRDTDDVRGLHERQLRGQRHTETVPVETGQDDAAGPFEPGPERGIEKGRAEGFEREAEEASRFGLIWHLERSANARPADGRGESAPDAPVERQVSAHARARRSIPSAPWTSPSTGHRSRR